MILRDGMYGEQSTSTSTSTSGERRGEAIKRKVVKSKSKIKTYRLTHFR